MKFATLKATLSLGLALFCSFPVVAARGQRKLVQLRISVYNSSPFSLSTIERAEAEASYVFRDAGVEVIWLNCPQDAMREASVGRCAVVSFPLHLRLHILRVSQGLKPSTVGISFLGEDGVGCHAELFYEPIQELQQKTGVAPSVILGHAMAHELGHLLLGTNSHFPNSLMRAHWTRNDLINASILNLRFSPEQSQRIMNRFIQGTFQEKQTIEIPSDAASTQASNKWTR